MRFALALLILFSLLGAVDHLWRYPVMAALPALGVICWMLFGRTVGLEKRIRELENMTRTLREDLAAASSGQNAAMSSVQAGDQPEKATPAGPEVDDVFTFSADAEESFAGGAPEQPPVRWHAAGAQPLPRTGGPVPPRSGSLDGLWMSLQSWLTAGNPVVKAGLVVLFFGVSFLLKYAAEHSLLPVELRMAGAAVLGIALLGLGWRLRQTRAVYALLVQGGGVGVLYLTVFAATRFMDMLPPELALAFLTLMVIFSGVLALVQNAPGLAVFGATGGFLAPILLSTGQGSHVHLFVYYALLNVGVLGVAWFKAWRVLNLLGFAFTFGIGAIWGAQYYRPEYLASTEPFLILFFVMYSLISILFARRQDDDRLMRLDSALVFGLPLVAFGLQMGLVRETTMGGAFSALALAAWYLAPITIMRSKGPGLRLLSEAHLVLGVIFVSLAVPLALDATWTASTWALEGAGMVWLGLRQGRLRTRVFGLLLQAGAALSFGFAMSNGYLEFDLASLLAGMFLGVGGLFSSWAYAEHEAAGSEREKHFSLMCGIWGGLWWYLSWFAWSEDNGGDFRHLLSLGVVLGSLGIWTVMHGRFVWPMARYLAALTVPFLLMLALAWSTHPGAAGGWIAWPLALIFHLIILYKLEKYWIPRVTGWIHAGSLVLVGVLLARENHWLTAQLIDVGAWGDLTAILAVVALLLAACLSRVPSWPFVRHRRAYLNGGGVLIGLSGLWWLAACFQHGGVNLLPYIPVFNPLDLAQLLVLAALAVWRDAVARSDTALWAHQGALSATLGAGFFVWLNVAVARAVHFWAEVPYAFDFMFRSDILQAAYAVLWTVSALLVMLLGKKLGQRRLWLSGAGLLGLVVVKLFLIDLDGSGTVPRIVSFLGVGLLMLVVGYFCPLPPKEEKS